jgi:hypothetical protein
VGGIRLRRRDRRGHGAAAVTSKSNQPLRAATVVALAAVCATLNGCARYWVCDLADSDRVSELPRSLSETGLYADIATGELAAGVLAYTPRFQLWSDGAAKQRWILLPTGAQIDTSNIDDWSFPEGTKLWKQFSVNGVRIETRLLEKRDPIDDGWVALSYAWSADDRDALSAPLGEIDARETDHDVPAAGECVACHGGRRSYVLGFSAIQLASAATPGEVDLAGLEREGRLTEAPTAIPIVPGTPTEAAALGYLHANCSHCHNLTRPARTGPRCFDPETEYDFTLAVGDLDSTATTATYRTVVGKAVKPGNPADSAVLERMGRRGFLRQMPPLATEKVDSEAIASIRAWIEGIP